MSRGSSMFSIDLNDGPWEEFYSNRKPKAKGTYTDGKKNGIFEKWYETGKKKSIGAYNTGEKTGKWKTWDEKGKRTIEKYPE